MAKAKTPKLEPEKPGAIEFGKTNLDADEFAPEHTKVRISMWIDGDTLNAVRARAADDHMKYQTWLNQQIRELVLGSKENPLEKRISELERAVFKRRA